MFCDRAQNFPAGAGAFDVPDAGIVNRVSCIGEAGVTIVSNQGVRMPLVAPRPPACE